MGTEQETYGCEFKFLVSAIFLFPVWPKTAVGRRFFPFFAIFAHYGARYRICGLIESYWTSIDA